MSDRLKLPFVCAMALAICANPLLAQDTRGSIAGTVTDPQSASIAGAIVTVTNKDAGSSTRLTTNTSGYYEASLLLPGRGSEESLAISTNATEPLAGN